MSNTLSSRDVVEALARISGRLDGLRDRLNAADRELGDGDTGMTVASVVAAWQQAIRDVPDDVGTLLQQLGRATRAATGSSLGSVLAIGLIAAGKDAAGKPVADRPAIGSMLAAAVAAITQRSGASPGDKTILDALIGIREAVEAHGENSLLDAAVAGAERALDAFRPLESKLGRARIYGMKSVGLDDPGMLAAVELLREARRPA